LVVDSNAELGADRVDVVHPDVDEPIRIRVPDVFGEVDLGVLAPDPHVRGQMRFETVFEDRLETEPPIPGNRA
jgi:hypothetical protein